jgi:ribosomal protein S18 acetylase RimI-like enzyme
MDNQPPGHNKNEQLVMVKIATPEDWESYKKMRLAAITSEEKDMFGRDSDAERVEEEKNRPDEDWQADLSRDKIDQFVVLAWKGSEAIGIVRAKERPEKRVWYLASAYTAKDSRGEVFPPKVLTEIISEVRKRGGSKVLMGVKAKNETMIHLATLLGFKKVEIEPNAPGFYMELDIDKK